MKANQHWQSWVEYFRSMNMDLHIMPNDNKHKSSKNCPCKPKITFQDEITKKKIFAHNETKKRKKK